ncbi:MAG: small subunit ribosomal protein S6 [Limisphaerales bacterium]
MVLTPYSAYLCNPKFVNLTMNQYELVVILTPILSEEEVKKTMSKYTDFITENGGSIVLQEAWGLRQLAYPITKKTTGIYQLLEYAAPGDLNTKMDVLFKRDDSIMRQLITRLDKYAVIYNERRRKGEVGRNKKVTAKAVPVEAKATAEEPKS